MRDLARRLLASSRTASDPHEHEAVRVCETLRVSVTRFAGADGFAALLRRALALARAEVPTLQTVRIGTEGRLEGFEQLAADTGGGSEAAITITAHLLELLVTFIGEPLTMKLMREFGPQNLWTYNSRSEAAG
jgi:hypothetical protein